VPPRDLELGMAFPREAIGAGESAIVNDGTRCGSGIVAQHNRFIADLLMPDSWIDVKAAVNLAFMFQSSKTPISRAGAWATPVGLNG